MQLPDFDDRLDRLAVRIIRSGLFLILIATFAKFVFSELWPLIGPLFLK